MNISNFPIYYRLTANKKTMQLKEVSSRGVFPSKLKSQIYYPTVKSKVVQGTANLCTVNKWLPHQMAIAI